MAKERPVTPEKQLLGLIEIDSSKSVGVHAHAARYHGMSFLSIKAWIGRISFFIDKLRRRQAGNPFQLDIKLLNKILMVLVAGLTLYFFTSLYVDIASLIKAPNLKTGIKEMREINAGMPDISVLKNTVSYYMEKVKQRDIFKIGAPPPSEKKSQPKEATAKIIEETQRFKLVGISWGKEPDAMVEDTVALRTFFIKRGSMLGRVKVEAIFKDKIVVSFEGEETELK